MTALPYTPPRSARPQPQLSAARRLGAIAFAALLVLPVLSSTYLAQDLTGLRVPIAVVSLLFCIPLVVRDLGFATRPALWAVVFIAGIIPAGLSNAQYSETNARQVLYHGALVFTVLPGYVFVKYLSRYRINPASYLAIFHTALFLYGIYTYFAQIEDWPIFLNALRQNPVFENGEIDYYSGWSEGARAYSVWFEPSYVAVVLPLAIGIIPLLRARVIRWSLIISMAVFLALTYSRSAWMVFLMMMLVGVISIRPPRSLIRAFVFSSYSFLVAVAMTFVVQHALDAVMPELSSHIRIASNIQGLRETIASTFLGTGTPELVGQTGSRFGASSFRASHIHNSLLSYAHWIGLLGLVFCLLPLIQLLRTGARLSSPTSTGILIFVYGALASITWGGDLLNLTNIWFSIGVFWAFADIGRRANRNPAKAPPQRSEP